MIWVVFITIIATLVTALSTSVFIFTYNDHGRPGKPQHLAWWSLLLWWVLINIAIWGVVYKIAERV